MALAALMAVRAAELSHLRFEDAVTSRRFEMQPWIHYDDGLAPCAVSQVMFSLERSMIAAVDDGLADTRKEKVTKGELFERVAQQCVSQSIGAGRRDIKRAIEIKLHPSEKQPRDVDFAVIESAVEVVGEAKAMEVSDPRDAASRNFQEQIGQVYEQLTKRLSALDNGMVLTDGNKNQYRGAKNVIGIGATLHPYSSSLGDPRMLSFANEGADTTRIAVADLHSWVLILTALHDVADLRRYLQFRDQLRQIEALSVDESDTALAYINPHRTEELARCRQLYENRDVDRIFTMPVTPCAVITLTALNRKKPKDRGQWRRTFFRDCHGVKTF